jgi:hypothetical protein
MEMKEPLQMLVFGFERIGETEEAEVGFLTN